MEVSVKVGVKVGVRVWVGVGVGVVGQIPSGTDIVPELLTALNKKEYPGKVLPE